MLWGLLFIRKRGARNNYGGDFFDYLYRSEKNAISRRLRRGHSNTQGCHACRRVETYLHSTIQGQEGRGERVAEGLVYSRFFDTQAADRSIYGVDGLLAALENKRIKDSLHAGTRPRKLKWLKY
jgi:hypothetical protein